MGNGVPNQGPWQHRQPNGVVVGYCIIYHDQMVTGNAHVHSPEVSPSDYASLRAAAAQGQSAFDTALASSGWASFFTPYPGVDKVALRAGVLDLD